VLHCVLGLRHGNGGVAFSGTVGMELWNAGLALSPEEPKLYSSYPLNLQPRNRNRIVDCLFI